VLGLSFEDPLWMVVPIVAPLAAGLIAFVCNQRLGPWGCLLSTILCFVASCCLTARVATLGTSVYAMGNWEAPIGIVLRADGLSCVMLLTSSLIAVIVSIYSLDYFRIRPSSAKPFLMPTAAMFWPLWMLLLSALNALFLSGDIFNLYVTLELMTLTAVGLIALAEGAATIQAAMRYLFAALTGSMFYFLAVSVLYGKFGLLDLRLLAMAVESESSAAEPALQTALMLMMVGLMLKSALFPFHFWLAPAHSAAPAPASAVLSGLVVKGSFYILLRFWFELCPPALTFQAGWIPAGLGSIAIIWGSIQAIFAERLKLLVAYSTVAQIGYLFLVFSLARSSAPAGFEPWAGCLLIAVSHALAKGAMFLAAGVILKTAKQDRIADLPEVAPRLPLTFFAMGMASVALMGLPPSGSFMGKWMMLVGALETKQYGYAAVMILGGLLAAVYLFRVLQAAFAEPAADGSDPEDPHAASKVIPKRVWRMEIAALVLAVVSLLLGIAPRPVVDLLRVGSPFSVEAGMLETHSPENNDGL
jgi:multicomponent Na+:H+ antiporter subunit D